MINILSYVGMNMQSEVCLWCLLGLVRTIFDATLFKVNANLKQVWQMTMPEELSMPVQRVLRTMVSGIMLVQCFTVYVYLASYIVLLYPVFLEERPTLVLPWLLLAAIRKLLCELTSLALGLGTCVLLGPARPPCIKFVIVKFGSIMPAFYMWMLVFSYYHALKVATAFKTFPAVLPPNDNDYGLELAVRRRRTKSLLGEEQLRKKLVANFYGETTSSVTNQAFLHPVLEMSSRMVHSTDTSIEETVPETEVMKPSTISTTGWSDIGAYEDWFGSEVMIPRDTDRILEQIVLMLLRIGAYLKKEGIEAIIDSQILSSAVPASWHQRDNIDCAAMNADDTDTPPLVGSNKGNMASYLREYPQIFLKKQNTDIPQTERTIVSLKTVHSHVEAEDNTNKSKVKHISSTTSHDAISHDGENVPSKKMASDKTAAHEETANKLSLSSHFKSKQIPKDEGKKMRSRHKKQRDVEAQPKYNVSEFINDVKNKEGPSEIKASKEKHENNDKDTADSQTSNDEFTYIKKNEEDNDDEFSNYKPLKEIHIKDTTWTDNNIENFINNNTDDDNDMTFKHKILNENNSDQSMNTKAEGVEKYKTGTIGEILSNKKHRYLSKKDTSRNDTSQETLTIALSYEDYTTKSMHSNSFNVNTNKELTQSGMLYNDINREIKLSNSNTEATNSKLIKDENNIATDVNIPNETKSEYFTGGKILDVGQNKDSTDSIILDGEKPQSYVDNTKSNEDNPDANLKQRKLGGGQ